MRQEGSAGRRTPVKTMVEVLCIVGSVSLARSQAAYNVIEEVIARLRPLRMISGGAKGVDTLAEDAARRHNIPFTRYEPAVPRWADGYKPRNLAMAKDCTYLVRIVASDSTTYGSGWTRDAARRRKKPTEEYVVDVKTRTARRTT